MKNVRIYDAGNSTCDRYTVVYMDEPEMAGGYDNCYSCLAMSSDPFSPLGFCQHSTAMPGRHLGRRIKFTELPQDCQKALLQDRS